VKYYISRSGQQYGPYSLEDLQAMKTQGRIDANDLAWGEGMASWTAVSQILESASGAAATPQPYTPPQQQPPYTPPQQQYTPPQQQYTPPQQQPQYTPPQQQYTPPQQQYTPPPQQYTPQAAQFGAAPAAYTPPAYNAGYGAQPMAGGPMPPTLSWVLVLVLGLVVPFFALVWIFIELGFVKKIDPSSPASKQFVTAIAALLGGFIIGFALIAGGSASEKPAFAALGGFILFAAYIVTIVFAILAMFSMRRSIQTYYNTVEPIGLKLSGVMTFFFNIYYFQYHFNRITNWKQTGRLEA
jgi:hypothetical protein